MATRLALGKPSTKGPEALPQRQSVPFTDSCARVYRVFVPQLWLVLQAKKSQHVRAAVAGAGFTCPGDVIVTDHKHASHAPASEPEPEMTHLYLAELNSRGKEVAPCLNGSSMMFYQVGQGSASIEPGLNPTGS